MNYDLKLFDTIAKEQLQKLEAIGILNTDALLSKAVLPFDRDVLAGKAGLRPDEITRLASLADLVRIKGVGPQMADVLVESGLVGNVQQFLDIMRVQEANTSHPTYQQLSRSLIVKTAAAIFIQNLSTCEKRVQNSRFIPSKRQLINAVEEAMELKPRLVLQVRDDNSEFRRKVLKKWQDEQKFVGKTNVWWVLVFIGIVATLFLAFSFMRYQNMVVAVINPMDDAYNQFIYTTNVYLGLDFLIIFTILAFFMGLVYLCWRIYLYLAVTQLKLLLFNAKVYQETYEAVQPDPEKEKKSSWLMIVVFAILALWFGYEVFKTAASIEDLLQIVNERVFVFGILLGVVATFPMLLRLINFRRDALNENGVQRYIIYLITLVSALPVIVFLATQVAIPVSFQTHDLIFEELLMPRIHANMTATREYIESYQAEDEITKWYQQSYLIEIDQWNDKNTRELLAFNTPDSIKMFNLFSQTFRRAILGLVAVAVMMLFIFPYLIYGGLGKGIFFILLLSISFFLDNFLQAQSPTWFSSESSPVAATVIIAICLLASALFFDWLYDYITSQPKFCPACSQELDKDDLFCKYCGLVQTRMPVRKSGLFKLLPERILRRK